MKYSLFRNSFFLSFSALLINLFTPRLLIGQVSATNSQYLTFVGLPSCDSAFDILQQFSHHLPAFQMASPLETDHVIFSILVTRVTMNIHFGLTIQNFKLWLRILKQCFCGGHQIVRNRL
jgi:hypothetical protein